MYNIYLTLYLWYTSKIYCITPSNGNYCISVLICQIESSKMLSVNFCSQLLTDGGKILLVGIWLVMCTCLQYFYSKCKMFLYCKKSCMNAFNFSSSADENSVMVRSLGGRVYIKLLRERCKGVGAVKKAHISTSNFVGSIY